jgi:hypothetical protein
LNKEISAKQEALWRDNQSRLDFSDPKQADNVLNMLTQLSPAELNSPQAYDLKELMVDLLQASNDKTFTQRDLSKDNGINFVESTDSITITQPFVKTDNVQIISISAEGIKLRNNVTGQETVLNTNTAQKAKEIANQRAADRTYLDEKKATIAKQLNIDLDDDTLSHADRQENYRKIGEVLTKAMFATDQRLFEMQHKMLLSQ